MLLRTEAHQGHQIPEQQDAAAQTLMLARQTGRPKADLAEVEEWPRTGRTKATRSLCEQTSANVRNLESKTLVLMSITALAAAGRWSHAGANRKTKGLKVGDYDMKTWMIWCYQSCRGSFSQVFWRCYT